ncbi:MAG: transcription elongation factor GreA [Deltaproteobacteria bacterium]|nr:transcription elongation factor GreA [Deltaproteobacteria bacterium]
MDLPIIERLKSELAELQRELAHDLPKRLEEARAHGDLRENAEYDAAKNRQGQLRARIGQINGRLAELATFSIARIPRDRAAYGSRVTVEDLDSGEESEFKLVFPEEVETGANTVSISSPIGKALVNKGVGDEVVVQTPSGRRTLSVLALVTLFDGQS